jgi:lysophospholipase L1-like esterase
MSKKCFSILAGLGWAIGLGSLLSGLLALGNSLAGWAQEVLARPSTGAQLYQRRWQAVQQGLLYGEADDAAMPAVEGISRSPTLADWQRLFAAEVELALDQGRPRVLLLGDSLTLWLPMQALDPRVVWLNQGISGENSDQIRQRLVWVGQLQPQRIYLMAGINDLKQGRSPAQVVTSLQQLIRSLRLQVPQSQLVVQSLLPTAGQVANVSIQVVNEQLSAFCQPQLCEFLDLYTDFVDVNGRLPASLSTDGLHLSPEGYALWQQRLGERTAPDR